MQLFEVQISPGHTTRDDVDDAEGGVNLDLEYKNTMALHYMAF